MKTKIIFSVIALLICASTATAETCTTTTTSTPAGYVPYQAQPYIQYCSSVSYTNYYTGSTTSESAVYSTPQCSACKRGYNLFTFYNTGTTQTDWTGTCEDYNPSFTICAKPCDSNCVSDEYYESESNGVESLTDRTCAYGDKICASTTLYRCINGYYGEAIDYQTGCTKCPNPQNDEHLMANSVPGEAISITDCFISKNSSYNSFSDSTGTYRCTEDAYYKL